MSDADIQWCTKCKNLWRSHDGCGVAHKSFVKEVETLELTETDEEVILDAIQQEKSITWRQALKLVEELQDTRAESAVRGDDRDELERRQERWARSYEAASGDSLGSRTPEEALSTLVDLLLPGSVAEFFEARETRGEEDDRAFLTDEEQSQTDVVAILKELARSRRLLRQVLTVMDGKPGGPSAVTVRGQVRGLFEELRVANIALLAQAEKTQKLVMDATAPDRLTMIVKDIAEMQAIPASKRVANMIVAIAREKNLSYRLLPDLITWEGIPAKPAATMNFFDEDTLDRNGQF